MGLVDSERAIIKVVGELKGANWTQLSRCLGFSTSYVDHLCRYLVRGSYLRATGRGAYALAPLGKKTFREIRRSMGLEEETRLTVDPKMLRQIAVQVGKEVAEAVRKEVKELEVPVRQVAAAPPQRVQPEKVQPEKAKPEKVEIRTDYPGGVEEPEPATLESNIEEIGVETEQETTDVSRLVKRFQEIKKKKRR